MKKFLCAFVTLALILAGCGDEVFIPEDIGEDIPSQAIASQNAAARKKRIETTTETTTSEAVTSTEAEKSAAESISGTSEKKETSSAVTAENSENSKSTKTKISDMSETSAVTKTHGTQTVSQNEEDGGSSYTENDSSSKPPETTVNNSSSPAVTEKTTAAEEPAQPTTEAYYLEGIVYEVRKTSVLINEVDLGKIDVTFSDPALFKDVKVGDSVEVTYNGELAATYPMQAYGTYSIDVTQKAGKNYSMQSFEYNDLKFTMLVPENWSSKVIEYPQEGDFTDWGIRFTPEGSGSSFDVSWHSAFEIRESADKIPVTINGMGAKEYRKSGMWKFVVFDNNYIAANNFFGTDEFDTYSADMDIMLKTLEFV